MKKLSLVWFLFAAANCLAQMTPQYATYATFSVDANNNVYQTVVVDGTTTGGCVVTYTYICGSGGQTCQGHYTIPGCPTAVHTPKINNMIGGVGGWSTGPGTGPFAYMSYQTTNHVTVQPAQLVPYNIEGQVACSAIGLLFDGSGSGVGVQNKKCGAVRVGGLNQTVSCNDTTSYKAVVAVDGTGSFLSDLLVSTSTPTSLVINLVGGPVSSGICSKPQYCYQQTYKAHKMPGEQGEIDWDLKMYCGSSTIGDADLEVMAHQLISCQ